MPYFSVTQGAVAKGRGKGGTSVKLLAKNAPEHLHVMPCVGKWSTGVTHCWGSRASHSAQTLQGSEILYSLLRQIPCASCSLNGDRLPPASTDPVTPALLVILQWGWILQEFFWCFSYKNQYLERCSPAWPFTACQLSLPAETQPDVPDVPGDREGLWGQERDGEKLGVEGWNPDPWGGCSLQSPLQEKGDLIPPESAQGSGAPAEPGARQQSCGRRVCRSISHAELPWGSHSLWWGESH